MSPTVYLNSTAREQSSLLIPVDLNCAQVRYQGTQHGRGRSSPNTQTLDLNLGWCDLLSQVRKMNLV